MTALRGNPSASAPARRGPSIPGWAWPAACSAGFLALAWILRRFVTDDAWISVRYAENLAGGHGFVWNPGGPTVEGFSNPLLVGVEALGAAAGLPPIDVARGLGIGCGIALLALIHVEGTAVLGRTAARAGMLLTALFPPFVLWAVGGLESVPAALATTAGTLALVHSPVRRRDTARAAVAFSILPWLRPEGLVIALAVAVASELGGLVRGPRRAAAIRLAGVAGPALASQAVLELLRLTAYGHLLPNSVLYKTGTGGTFDVLSAFVAIATPVIAAAALGTLAARGRQCLLAVPVVVYLAGSLRTMDSADAFSRFFVPAWPSLALLAGLAVAAAGARVSAARTAAIAAGVLLAILTMSGLADLPAVASFDAHYASCKQHARSGAAAWLDAHTAPDTVFSVSDAGLVPALAGGRTAIDQFMLNDPSIQRTGRLPVRRRVADVYGRHPDVLVLASRRPHRFAGVYGTDRAMRHDRRFAAFHLAAVARGGGARCAYHLFLYQRSTAR